MGTSSDLTTYDTASIVAPIIKRATGTLSDGSAVVMVPDINSTSGHGTDITGVAKVRFYKSDTTRTTWALNFTWTPGTVFGSSTFQALMSMVVDSSNNIHVVWSGTNGSLNYCLLTFGSGTWTAGTLQAVQASNAVTRRYRAVDIDVATGTAGSTATLAIAAYESKTSAGLSAWARLFVRKNDNTTWTNSFTEDFATSFGSAQNIKPGSEDISLSFNTAGVVSNVVDILLAYSRMSTIRDLGDPFRECTFNISTAAATSNQYTILGVGVGQLGSPCRRTWIYKLSNTMWQVANITGSSQPIFTVMRLTSGAYSTTYAKDQIISSGTTGASTNISFYMTAGNYNYIAVAYCDNQVVFGFLTSNVPTFSSQAINSALAAIVFTYKNGTDVAVTRKDTGFRPLDNYLVPQILVRYPFAIYSAGNNRTASGDHSFNFLALYGVHAATATYTNPATEARVICDTEFSTPLSISPSTAQASDNPTLQATVKSALNYPFPLAKMEWQLALDAAFSSGLLDMVEPDSAFRYIGSKSSAAASLVTTIHKMTGVAPERIYSNNWFMRARVVDDLGSVGPWSTTAKFTVQHQPTCSPLAPLANQIISYNSGSPVFSWQFSDPEVTDSQTAYQIQVIDPSTNTTYSTGKITSNVTSGTISGITALKDFPLTWQVQTWDTDDVAGPFCNPVPFTMSDPPTVTITAPTDGGVQTSPAPTITWNYGSATGKAQKAFRVIIDACLMADLFDRTTSNAFGNSSSGNAWTLVGTPNTSYSTDGTYGNIFIGDVVNQWRGATNGFVENDSDQIVKVRTNVTATGAPINAYILARYKDTSNYLTAGIQFKPGGTYTVNISGVVAGASVLNVSDGGTSTYTTATDYYIRFRTAGTTLMVRVWAASTPEPSNWTVSTTAGPTALVNGVGGLQVMQQTSCTNTTTTISFSDYSVVDAYPTTKHLADTYWIYSSVQSYQFSANILTLGTYYRYDVTVQDAGGLQTTAHAITATSWIHPALANYQVGTDDYSAIVTWDNSTIDTEFNSWRVWRRYQTVTTPIDFADSRDTWVLVAEIQDGLSTNFIFTDYLTPVGKNVDYVVTQTADRFGSIVDSSITSYTTIMLPSSRYFFVPDVAIGGVSSYMVKNVTADGYTDQTEQAVLLVVDRGNQIQVGTDMGIAGTLTVQLRDMATAQADRQFFTYLAKNGIGCTMKNPFGDVVYIKLSPIPVNLMAGTGKTEISDLTMAYTESYKTTVQITRLS